jgi:hypothetical protein
MKLGFVITSRKNFALGKVLSGQFSLEKNMWCHLNIVKWEVKTVTSETF